ncbi:MAG TPA: PAS domain-containing sensor histidine kinase, partial [Candidatus Limnocylindrales bacterium]
ARLAALESEQRQIFDDAQRQADVMFAQYQLSQLLASGDSLPAMAEAVLAELARTSAATAAALWLAEPGRATLELVATTGDPDSRDGGRRTRQAVPPRFASAIDAAAWCRGAGWSGVSLEERRDLGEGGIRELVHGFVAVAAEDAGGLDPDHARFLSLVRHELAIAFRAAQLRETLAHERALLTAILDGAGDAIVAVDRECRIVRLNDAAAMLLAADRHRAVGETCRDFLGCERPAAGDPAVSLRCGQRCPFAEVMSGGQAVSDREQVVVGRDGTPIPVAATVSPMPGRARGAVAVLRDLRASRALDELKSTFVSAVSHELRTPLALVGGYVQSLLHLDLDPETERRYLERVTEAVDRLGELVNQIIDISHVESDRLALRREPTRLADIVAGLTSELAELPARRPLLVSLDPDLPRVDVDPTRVRQVLANLVANAAKYAGPAATVSLRAIRAGDVVEVTVEDDGPGVDPDERDRLFERFFRGRRVRESNIPGSGLGLYLCRRLIEAHGTWIRLDDRERGTAVTFAVPIARPGRSRDATTLPVAEDALAVPAAEPAGP